MYFICFLGYIYDVKNNPIEGAVIVDESSSSTSKSSKNGSYKLSVNKGKFLKIYFKYLVMIKTFSKFWRNPKVYVLNLKCTCVYIIY